MNHVTIGALSLLLLAPACGTAVEQDPRPPSPTGATLSAVPERSAPPVYYDSNTPIDPVVTHRMNMQMVTRNAIAKERRALTEPSLNDACGWAEPTVYFADGDAKLGDDHDATIDSIAVCLRSEPLAQEPVVLIGYADARGPAYDNLELGLQRAKEVKQQLVETGISADRIETYSRGEYLVDDDNELQDDRRVVVKLDR